MTYPINTNIPAANNYPGDDQPIMQQNFANINGYVQVDHTNPAAVGAGEHKQVTFFSNNTPAVPTSPPVLFTSLQDGAGNALPGALPQLFFYSGSATAGKNNYVSNVNGSTMGMNGIIMKWGQYFIPGTGFNQPVNFPVPFPNNCFSVIAVGNQANKDIYIAGCTSLTPSGFVAVKSSASTGFVINYIAIGN